MQGLDQRHGLLDRHAVAQYARDQFRIVPELLVKQARDAADGVRIAVTVGVLEVVAFRAVLLAHFDNESFLDLRRDIHGILLDLAGEDLVGASVLQAHEGDPVFGAVLEAHDVGGNGLRTLLHLAGMPLTALLFLGVLLQQHAVAAAVAVDRDALAAALPRRAVNVGHQRLRNVVRQVHRHRDRVIDPLLDGALHLHLSHPVDVVGRSAVVGRRGDPLVQFGVGDRRELRRVVSVRLQPLHEIVVVDVVLLELFARFVLVIDMRVVVRGVDLAAALVNRAEHRFDARRGLRHERRGARRSDGQHGDVAAADLRHLLVERRIGLADAGDHRVVRLLGGIVDREGSALGGQLHRRAVSGQREGLLHLDGEIDRLLRTVAQSQGGEHVALGRNAEPRAAALLRHFADLLP